MNIKEAKKHIQNTVRAYLQKDESGNYLIPCEKQRPVFLYGPPGIGKTAIMEQIARESEIGLVTYSMTHHTRQSALGLPYITKKTFGGKEYSVSEYTMSEILASVYEYIEQTGKKEGILFLDEINCVSETLAPSMLRFLQYKTFGSHTVPDGWVTVTAGNPPEYNKSVREYDIATLDRLKKISVEADYGVWREYAVRENVHPSILSYLDINERDFYIIENTPTGKKFVTARGWEDLSRIMKVFEKNDVPIDFELTEQYIQSETVASGFADYYKTYKALFENYSVECILNANATDTLREKLNQATVGEKCGLINMLCDALGDTVLPAVQLNTTLKMTAELLKEHNIAQECSENGAKILDGVITALNVQTEKSATHIDRTDEQKSQNYRLCRKLESIKNGILQCNDEPKEYIAAFFKNETDELYRSIQTARDKIANCCDFLHRTFGNSPELQIFIANMTLNRQTALFLACFGCDRFSQIADYDIDI